MESRVRLKERGSRSSGWARLDLLERVYVMQQISTEPVELDLSVGFIHCEIVKGLIDAVEPFDFLRRKKMGDMPP